MKRARVIDLVSEGVLRVEDGNHGNDRPRPDEFVPSGVSFIRAADMTDGFVDFSAAGRISDVARARIRKGVGAPGDVILSHKGTVGKVAVAPLDSPEFVCSPQTTFWRSLDESVISQAYLRYVLVSDDFKRQLEILQGQTDMAPYVSLTDQRSMTLIIPDVANQKAIAEVLGALDDKIAVNNKLAAAAEDFITAQHARAIRSAGTVLRPLLSAVDFDFGEAFKGSEFSEPGVGRPLIRIRDLKTFTSQVWTTESRIREILIQPGDVVVGMDAEFRPTSWLGEPGLLNQRVCRARGKLTGPAFVREALKEPLGRIEGFKSATTVIHLNKKDLQEAEILIPNNDCMAIFEASVEVLYSKRVALAVENRTLAAIRDTLLPQLMSGKLLVKEEVLENAGLSTRSAVVVGS